MLDKKQMSEEDIKFRYISPAITSKWNANNVYCVLFVSRKFFVMSTSLWFK